MPLTLRSSTSFITKTPFKTGNDTVLLTPTTLFFSKITPSSVSVSASASASSSWSTQKTEKLHTISVPHRRNSDDKNNAKVPVYVMLPLDTMTLGGSLHKPKAMNVSLMALKNAGVEGVMVDAWWGLVEKDGPMKYNWEGYAELVQMVAKHGLKLQAVMSFHQCGGNVGDSCSIPLPPWVLEEISQNTDLVYTDRSGRRNPEYISLGCDSLPVLRGRTPIQVYTDFMRSFRERFTDYLGSVIAEVQVGMGPCGELRYPAYPESNGTWRFPGIGEFQCYDKYMRASLQASAEAAGNKEWGIAGPHDSGHYNQYPEETGFFKREGTWNSEYGQFFLDWYSEKLLDHGDKILSAADATFQGTGTKLSGKVAGIHWHYKTRSHAAELTAGYYNTRHHDGYLSIAKMMKRYEVVLNFTCMEMKDGEQPDHAECSPEGLVKQVKMAAKLVGIELAGENALERYDAGAYEQVMATSRSDSGNGLSAFTFLRLNRRLFEGDNWRNLVDFVRNMSEGGRKPQLSEEDCGRSDLIYVGLVEVKAGDNKEAALIV